MKMSTPPTNFSDLPHNRTDVGRWSRSNGVRVGFVPPLPNHEPVAIITQLVLIGKSYIQRW